MRKNKGWDLRSFLLPLCLMLFGTNSWANDDIWTRDKLLGDVGGARTKLGEYGVDLDVRFSQYYQGVVSGGSYTDNQYGGKVDYLINIDAEKLGLWKGLGFSLHAETRYGKDILSAAGDLTLPNAGMTLPLPGNYEDTDLTGYMITQSLLDGELELFLGKLNTLDLVTTIFPEYGYGQEGFWNVMAGVTALPWFRFINLSEYGGGFFTINKKRGVEGGFLFVGEENVSTSLAPSISDSFDEGVGLLAFYRFFYQLDDTHPGYFMIFAGGSTKRYNSLDELDWLVLPGEGLAVTKKKMPWDVAAYLEQDFWQAQGNSKRRAYVKIGGTYGNDNPNFSKWNIFTQVEAFGAIPSRPRDRMGVSGWYNGITNDVKGLTSTLGIGVRDNWGFEIYYNAEITPWLHVSPDLQFLMNSTKGDDIAIVPGARLVLDL